MAAVSDQAAGLESNVTSPDASKAEHTEGPWRAERGRDQLCDYGTTVASVATNDPSGARWWIFSDVETHGDSEGDARLIAAAPEMFALLQELIDIEGPQPGHVVWANKVKALLAKVQP